MALKRAFSGALTSYALFFVQADGSKNHIQSVILVPTRELALQTSQVRLHIER